MLQKFASPLVGSARLLILGREAVNGYIRVKFVTHGSTMPNRRLPSQPLSIAAVWPVSNYTAWLERRCVCSVQLVRGS